MRYKAGSHEMGVLDSDTGRLTAALALAQAQSAELQAPAQIIARSVASGTGELEANEG